MNILEYIYSPKQIIRYNIVSKIEQHNYNQ